MPKERLAVLLARLGIDIMKMVKTEKDMQELNLELNLSHDFGRITGDGSGAVAKGPGFTGMVTSQAIKESTIALSFLRLVACDSRSTWATPAT